MESFLDRQGLHLANLHR